MKLHAFVAMPFGIKMGPDGKPIDFNRVYEEYIKPALEAAGLEVFRADYESRGGDIRTNMFQELLIAYLVVNLTLDNPNVWYELGVRHALRARGVVLVQSDRSYHPFYTFTDRKLYYSLKKSDPDPKTLEKARAALTRMAEDTLKSWHDCKIISVFSLLPNLEEPEWKSLTLRYTREFLEAHNDWAEPIKLAGKSKRVGDIQGSPQSNAPCNKACRHRYNGKPSNCYYLQTTWSTVLIDQRKYRLEISRSTI